MKSFLSFGDLTRRVLNNVCGYHSSQIPFLPPSGFQEHGRRAAKFGTGGLGIGVPEICSNRKLRQLRDGKSLWWMGWMGWFCCYRRKCEHTPLIESNWHFENDHTCYYLLKYHVYAGQPLISRVRQEGKWTGTRKETGGGRLEKLSSSPWGYSLGTDALVWQLLGRSRDKLN